jgi:hypothetical protein
VRTKTLTSVKSTIYGGNGSKMTLMSQVSDKSRQHSILFHVFHDSSPRRKKRHMARIATLLPYSD